MKVDLSPEALADLQQIARTIAVDNPRRAATFVAELKAKFITLAATPEAFPVVGYYGGVDIGRRVHNNYLIFYRLRADSIVVWRVLHGARDYVELLGLGLHHE